jgi:CHAD domain-containing protein
MILKDRADLVSKARKLAAPARGLSPPRVRRQDLSRKKLTTRLRDRSKTLARKIAINDRGVAESGREVKELHRLRRDSRSLRYTIEFFEHSKDRSTLSQQLRSIQDSLGSVRDCDGALRLLLRCGASKSDPAFVRLTSKRRAMYASFARTRSESLDGVRALAKST